MSFLKKNNLRVQVNSNFISIYRDCIKRFWLELPKLKQKNLNDFLIELDSCIIQVQEELNKNNEFITEYSSILDELLEIKDNFKNMYSYSLAIHNLGKIFL